MLNSRAEGPSKAFLLLFHAKSLATMETVLTAHFAHFFPSVLISHSNKMASNTLCILILKRKLSSSFYLLPSQWSERERWQNMWCILYWFNLPQREGTEIQRDCLEILAEVVGVLFISSKRAIWCDFTQWDAAWLFIPWQVNKAMDCV